MSQRVNRTKRETALLDELMEETPELLARLDSPPAPDAPLPLLPISDIAPDPGQPRSHVRKDSIDALAEDIRRVGVLQPVVVRPAPDWNGYILVFGERRYRAALQAGLTHLPAIVRRDLTDIEVLELQWQENAQREDIDDIDKAIHLKRLKEISGRSWTQLAEVVHLSRRHLLRMQQMAEMPEGVLSLVRARRLTPSHLYQLARITSPERQVALASEAVAQHWSVNKLSQAIQEPPTIASPSRSTATAHPWISLADTLRQRLQSREVPTAEEQEMLVQISNLAAALIRNAPQERGQS